MVTFALDIDIDVRPGEMVMVWLPRAPSGIRDDEVSDEIPMSISGIARDHITITVKGVGPTTRSMLRLRPGDRIGVAGPFGRGFTVEGDRPLLIGGGVGMAPLMPLLHRFLATATPLVIAGGASSADIPFLTQLRSVMGANFSTEDGSLGTKGMVLDVLDTIDLSTIDAIYCCGPMRMLERLWGRLSPMGLPIEMSLETRLRCGRGLCGSCAIGPYRVCRDGPVFDGGMLGEIWSAAGEREAIASEDDDAGE